MARRKRREDDYVEDEYAEDYLEELELEDDYDDYEEDGYEFARLVAPESLGWEDDYCEISGHYTRTLYVHTFPQSVEDGWLAPLLRFAHPLEIAIFIQPLPVRPTLRRLRQREAIDAAAIERELEDGLIPDQRRKSRLRDTLELIELYEQDLAKPFQVVLVITIRAAALTELDRTTEELESRMPASATTRRLRLRQKAGFETTQPLARNEIAELNVIREMHTQAVMTCFPFVNSDVTHGVGVLIGQSLMTRTPIIINRFLQPPHGNVQSPNAAIIGATGSGKSYLAKLEMLRWAYQAVPVIVIDPSGEYRPIANAIGGQSIRIAIDSRDRINPLDFSYAISKQRQEGNPLREKITYLLDLVRVMLRTEDSTQIVDAYTRQILGNALVETYRKVGFHVDDPSSLQGATPERMPTLSDLYAMLVRMQRATSPRDQIYHEKVRPLIASLASFVGDGAYASLFDHRSTVDLRNPFCVFNIAGLADSVLPMMMHLVLEFLRTYLFTEEQAASGKNKLLYVDEAQRLMSFPETASFLDYTARTCRKYGVGLTVMTQTIGSFLLNTDGSENKAGRGVIGNCSLAFLLKQQPPEARPIQDAFKLTRSEVVKLLGAQTGEGLLILDQESTWFTAYGLAHPDENSLMTTSVVERAELAAKAQQRELSESTEGWPHQAVPRRRELPPGFSSWDDPLDTDALDDSPPARDGDWALPPAS